MIESCESSSFSEEMFDDNFFRDYEEQLAGISIEEQAAIALTEILTIEKADGSEKTYEELRSETSAFFANDWVRNDEAIMNLMAVQFAQSCVGHAHGAELSQDSQLSTMFEKGMNSSDDHDHDKNTNIGVKHHHDHDDDDDDEIDPKTGKKKKRSKKKSIGKYALFRL